MRKLFGLVLFLALISNTVFAEDDTLDAQAITEKKQTVFTEQIAREIGEDAVNNILNPTRVTCFKIAKKSNLYSGETLNGYGLLGTCGSLKGKASRLITQQIFKNRKNINFIKKEKCIMHPEYIIRYSNGFDNTDVLLSLPCYAVMVTYGGRSKIYNFKPGAEFLTKLDVIFEKRIKKLGATENKGPIRKWENKKKKMEVIKEKKKEENNFGWNNLNYGFGNK
jgi:hypothetical protein